MFIVEKLSKFRKVSSTKITRNPATQGKQQFPGFESRKLISDWGSSQRRKTISKEETFDYGPLDT